MDLFAFHTHMREIVSWSAPAAWATTDPAKLCVSERRVTNSVVRVKNVVVGCKEDVMDR